MDTVFPVFMFVFMALIPILIIALVIWAIMREKKRSEAWGALAQEMGFGFTPDDREFHSRYPEFKLFQQGHSRRGKNILEGEAGGIGVCVADYQYTTGSGKNSSTHMQTIFLLTSQNMQVPHCFLRPQHFFDRFGKWLGGQDIDFDEDSAFSEAFVLQGENEAAVRDLFDAPTRAFFVKQKENCITFEARNNMLLYHQGKRIEPGEMQDVLANAFQVLQLWSAS